MSTYPNNTDNEVDLLKKITENTAEIADGGGGSSLPDQTGQAGKVLSTDGTNPEWIAAAGGGDALTSQPLSQFAATTSAELRGVISDETGSGALYFQNGALGTPASGVATNLTGTAAGLTAGAASAVAVGGITGLGTGVGAALAINVGSVGAPVVLNGAGGTPSAMVGTNITGTAAGLTAGAASAVAVGGITGLGANVGAFLATPSSANLAAAVTGETGSGALVFGTGPTVSAPVVTGIQTNTGTKIITPAAMAALAIDTSQEFNTKTFAAGDTTTFSGAPGTTNQWFGAFFTNSSGAAITVVIPSSVSVARSSAITSVIIPANGYIYLKWFYVTGITTYFVFGDSPLTTGTGNFVLSTSPTITTPVIESPSVNVAASSLADDTYTGITISSFNAGVNLTQWEAVYLDSSSTWQKADANGSGTYPMVGVVVATVSSANPAIVLTNGAFRNDGGPAFTVGGTVYLSETAGAITTTIPSTSGSQVQAIGTALAARIAYVNPPAIWFTVT